MEFSLSPIEQDILLLAVAPEIDLKYETLFAYLNNDITRKWPTFDLALRIVRCSSQRKDPTFAAACCRKQSSSAADCCKPSAQSPNGAHGWRRVFRRRRQFANISRSAASLDPRLASFVEQRTSSADWQRLPISC